MDIPRPLWGPGTMFGHLHGGKFIFFFKKKSLYIITISHVPAYACWPSSYHHKPARRACLLLLYTLPRGSRQQYGPPLSHLILRLNKASCPSLPGTSGTPEPPRQLSTSVLCACTPVHDAANPFLITSSEDAALCYLPETRGCI